jgi:hypothetical protein
MKRLTLYLFALALLVSAPVRALQRRVGTSESLIKRTDANT